MNKISRLGLLIIIMILVFSSTVFAKPPNPNSDFYVYDELKLIDNDLRNHIVNINTELKEKTGSQIVVAIIDGLDGDNINRFATEMFEKWKIGSDEKDNGVLILASINDREIWIEVGYGLEGALPDSKIGNIIDEEIIPEFLNENYSIGIENGFNRILSEIESEYDIELTGLARRTNRNDNILLRLFLEFLFNESIPLWIRILVLVVVLVIFIFLVIITDGEILFIMARTSRNGGSSSSRGGGGRSGGGGARGKW